MCVGYSYNKKKNYLKLEGCIPKNENSRESLRTLFQHNLLAAVEP